MLASLLLDGFGWLGVAREPLGAAAALGGAAAVVAGALADRRRRAARAAGARARGSRSACSPARCCPVQGAVNARLRADVDAPVAVGAVLAWSGPRGSSAVASSTAAYWATNVGWPTMAFSNSV